MRALSIGLLMALSLTDMMGGAKAATMAPQSRPQMATEAPSDVDRLVDEFAPKRTAIRMDFNAGRISEEEYKAKVDALDAELERRASALRKK